MDDLVKYHMYLSEKSFICFITLLFIFSNLCYKCSELQQNTLVLLDMLTCSPSALLLP